MKSHTHPPHLALPVSQVVHVPPVHVFSAHHLRMVCPSRGEGPQAVVNAHVGGRTGVSPWTTPTHPGATVSFPLSVTFPVTISTVATGPDRNKESHQSEFSGYFSIEAGPSDLTLGGTVLTLGGTVLTTACARKAPLARSSPA